MSDVAKMEKRIKALEEELSAAKAARRRSHQWSRHMHERYRVLLGAHERIGRALLPEVAAQSLAITVLNTAEWGRQGDIAWLEVPACRVAVPLSSLSSTTPEHPLKLAGYEGACAVVKPKPPKPNTPGEA